MTVEVDQEHAVGFLKLVYSHDETNESVELATAMFDSKDDLLSTWNDIPAYQGPEGALWVAVDMYDEDGNMINTRRVSQAVCESLASEPLEKMVARGLARNLAMLTILNARMQA